MKEETAKISKLTYTPDNREMKGVMVGTWTTVLEETRAQCFFQHAVGANKPSLLRKTHDIVVGSTEQPYLWETHPATPRCELGPLS